KLIAVGARQRIPLLPEAPTVAESGVPRYEAVSWIALYAPAGTPHAIVMKINEEERRTFVDPEFCKSLLDRQFVAPIARTREAIPAYVKSEEQKWSKVIRDAKVKAE